MTVLFLNAFFFVFNCPSFTARYVNGVTEPREDGGMTMGQSMLGSLPLWVCSEPSGSPWQTTVFFVSFTLIAAMVVMSLFIGVITIGMFSEYQRCVRRPRNCEDPPMAPTAPRSRDLLWICMCQLSECVCVACACVRRRRRRYQDEIAQQHYDAEVAHIKDNAFTNPKSLLRLSVDWAMGIPNPNLPNLVSFWLAYLKLEK